MRMADHFEDLGEQPGPQWLSTPVEECVAIDSVIEHGRRFLNCDFQKLHSLQSLGLQLFAVGEWVVPLETLQHDARIDIDQEMVVLGAVVQSLEGLGFILDSLYGLEEALQLAALIRPGGSGRCRDVADELCGQGRRRRAAICSCVGSHLDVLISLIWKRQGREAWHKFTARKRLRGCCRQKESFDSVQRDASVCESMSKTRRHEGSGLIDLAYIMPHFNST